MYRLGNYTYVDTVVWYREMFKVVIIVMASFFPIFLNTINGVLNCDIKLLEVGESFGFTRKEEVLQDNITGYFTICICRNEIRTRL